MNDLNLIYGFILDNELCTEGELDMAVDVGGYNADTLNYVIYRQTGYHDIEQLYECEPEGLYYSDEVKAEFNLEGED